MNATAQPIARSTTSSVLFGQGQGGLSRLDVRTPWSQAEIYLLGAHVTHFQKAGEPPLLFLSGASRFVTGQPIRGGIPVIFPWFGPREGLPAHGFARIHEWVLESITWDAEGACGLQFRLPRLPGWNADRPYAVEYAVRVGRELQLGLRVVNESPRDTFEFEDCLHTYFAVADIGSVRVNGLAGARYLDSLENHAERTETAESIMIRSEVDRVYVGTEAAVDILDATLKRQVSVRKSGSRSTVVWNPWIAKSKRMPDFGDEEYHQMLCVESGNVGSDRVVLPPGASHHLRVTLDSTPL